MTPILTHDGVFHADEVLATAIFMLTAHHKTQIVRSRKEMDILQATCVFDVGGKYDPEKGLFDHHQERAGITSVRFGFENCATAGLVWDWFGPAAVVSHFQHCPELVEGLDLADIVKEVYTSFIKDVDQIDIGMRRPEKGEFSFSHSVSSFNPVFNEDYDSAYLKALSWVTMILGNQINQAVAVLRDRKDAIMAFEQAEQVAVFDRYLNGWRDIVPERIKRVVFPRLTGGWSVQRPDGAEDLISPEEAKVLLGDDLIFVHQARFIGATKTRFGAFALASANITGSL